MAGKFEVFVDAESHFRFRLKAPDGTELAVSAAFADKRGAAAGIAAVRECAGMGLITDLCPANRPGATPEAAEPAAIPQAHENEPARADGLRARARKLRRAAARPRWTGTAWVSARVAGA